MVRAVIVSALRNAVERGYSLEQGRISLINAGYPQNEVDVATSYLSSAIENVQQTQQFQPAQQPSTFQPIQPQQPQTMQNPVRFQQLPNISSTQTAKKSPFAVILLSLILLLLVSILTASLFFKDEIITFLKNSFGA